MPRRTLTDIGERVQLRLAHNKCEPLILEVGDYDAEEWVAYINVENPQLWRYAYLAEKDPLRPQSFSPLPTDGKVQVSLGTNLFLAPRLGHLTPPYPRVSVQEKAIEKFCVYVECPLDWEINILTPLG